MAVGQGPGSPRGKKTEPAKDIPLLSPRLPTSGCQVVHLLQTQDAREAQGPQQLWGRAPGQCYAGRRQEAGLPPSFPHPGPEISLNSLKGLDPLPRYGVSSFQSMWRVPGISSWGP